jgi:biopolymer transport protein ExbD
VIFHNKNGIFAVNGVEVDKENLQNHLDSLPSDKPNKFLFCFDKEVSFEKYLEAIVYLNKISVEYPSLQLSNTQYIY